MSMQSQAEAVTQEMIRDPASYVATAAASSPWWLTSFDHVLATVAALLGIIYLVMRIRGAILHNRGLKLDNEAKRRTLSEGQK